MEPTRKKEEISEKTLVLREYQLQLINIADSQNTIIFLPTGSGKTFIAIEVLKRRGAALKGTLDEGGKRAVFLAPTKALVYQLTSVLRTQVPFKAACYTGDMNVDVWSKNKWLAEFNKYQVFVMTPKILENLLQFSYIKVSIFDLIVVDECHNAVEDHSARSVMKELANVGSLEQPRIIGLTATLLNRTVSVDQIKDELQALEITFHGTIATCSELAEVLTFSTKPRELVQIYEVVSCINSEVEEISTKGKTLMKGKKTFYHKDKNKDLQDGLRFDISRNNLPSEINRNFMDFDVQFSSLGGYAGAVAALYHAINSEQSVLRSKTESEFAMNSYQSTTFFKIRDLLLADMNYNQSVEEILNKSTDKIHKTLEIVKKFCVECQQNKEELSAIIFVERRSTAIILYYIIKKLVDLNYEGFENIRSRFVISSKSNPLKEAAFSALQTKWLRHTLNLFREGKINLLIATNLLEEGVDVRTCNLVIAFDCDKITYRNYVQTKGRARSETSRFVMLTSDADAKCLAQKISLFTKVQERLNEILVGRSQDRIAPTFSEIKEDLYNEEIETYYPIGPSGPHCSSVNAISFVTAYCCQLPHDLYSLLTPIVYIKQQDGKYQALVELPIQCPIRHKIQGTWMRSRRMAKRSAYVEAVRMLHQSDELDDNFAYKGVTVPEFDDSYLFPHYTKEDLSEADSLPGTKKRRRMYNTEYPSCFINVRPKPNETCYMHVILFEPECTVDISRRKRQCIELLRENQTLALLTTSTMPSICAFPLHMSLGRVMCTLKNNAQSIALDREQLEKIGNFQFNLFSKLLNIVKSCQAFSRYGGHSNDYFVVPVRFIKDSGIYELDWDVILYSSDYLTKREYDEDIIGSYETQYLHRVVSPYYRNVPDFYITTGIRTDMSPMSSFPGPNNTTFESYYREKYEIEVKNFEQPLLEVQHLPHVRNNYIRPRIRQKTGGIQSSRKLQEHNEELDELLLPELCHYYEFPAGLWLKCILLPTTLYRITCLSLVDELRVRIMKDTGIGIRNEMSPTWQNLQSDEALLNEEERKLASKNSMPNPNLKVKKTIDPTRNLNQNGVEEPADVFLNMDRVAVCDLQHIMDYVDKRQKTYDSKSSSLNYAHDDTFTIERAVHCLQVLENKVYASCGPELCDLLQAITANSANDIVNLERLETLGDSFLKFAACLFVFREFPQGNEGHLVLIKSRLVSNRNLFYCGRKKGVEKLVQVHEFEASDFIAPNFIIPNEVGLYAGPDRLLANPNFLYYVEIPDDDRQSGILSSETKSKLHQQLDLLQPSTDAGDVLFSTFHALVSRKVISDKTIADSCEALIGTYLKNCGVEGGFAILEWLNVLPKNKGSFVKLITQRAESPLLKPTNPGEVGMQLGKLNSLQLESVLDYTFNDKSYLLQALTHPTFPYHRLTDCYQRLEFLGDAVLDVLVTMYICQEHPRLTPGEISLLRTAVVNNTTFACLTVRYGFYKHILFQCPPLGEAIQSFVEFQKERDYEIDEAIGILLEEIDCTIAEAAEVPKVLGDVFESIAGAIFLDSGNSLEAVWRVYYKLLRPVLEKFEHAIPRNSIMILHETLKKKPEISYKEFFPGTIAAEMFITDLNNKVIKYYGIGRNKFEAKRSAAKLALKALL